MKRIKHKKVRTKPLAKVIIIIASLWIIISFCENRAALIPAEFMSTTASAYAQNKVNGVIRNKIDAFDNTYDISLNEEGELAAVNTDSAKIAMLKSELTEEINKSLEGSQTGWVPIGDLLSYRLFSGRGFKIPVKLHFTGNAQVDLKSEIVSAGINQSKYRLSAVVTGKVFSASVSTPAGADFSAEYPICETVIMGDTPSGIFAKQ